MGGGAPRPAGRLRCSGEGAGNERPPLPGAPTGCLLGLLQRSRLPPSGWVTCPADRRVSACRLGAAVPVPRSLLPFRRWYCMVSMAAALEAGGRKRGGREGLLLLHIPPLGGVTAAWSTERPRRPAWHWRPPRAGAGAREGTSRERAGAAGEALFRPPLLTAARRLLMPLSPMTDRV